MPTAKKKKNKNDDAFFLKKVCVLREIQLNLYLKVPIKIIRRLMIQMYHNVLINHRVIITIIAFTMT